MKNKTEGLSELEKATHSFRQQISKQKELYETRLKEKEETIRKLLEQIQGQGIEHRMDGSVAYNPNSTEEVKYSDVTEFMKMKYDIRYFGKYILKNVFNYDIWNFQCDWLDAFKENKFTAINAFRQSGKSLMCCIMILWEAIFVTHSVNCIIGIKNDNCKLYRAEITKIIDYLVNRRFIGIVRNTENLIELDNGSKITFISEKKIKPAVKGFAPNLTVCDEFAFWENQEVFMQSTFPVISGNANSKLVIMSMPNGYNHFREIMTYGKPDIIKRITTTVSDADDLEKWKETVQKMIYLWPINIVRQEYYCEFIGPEDPGAKVVIGKDIYYLK